MGLRGLLGVEKRRNKIDWIKALKCEMKSAVLLAEQEDREVQFDLPFALQLIERIEEEQQELYDIIRPLLPWDLYVAEVKKEGEYNWVRKPFLKNGEYNNSVITHYGSGSNVVAGPFTRIEWKEPDLGKRERLANLLLKLGWEPEHFTETGIPQLVYEKEPVESLQDIEGDLGKHLARWFTLNHRKSQASGFFKHLSINNTIPAECTGTPTNTFRVKHRKVANIPKADPKTILGKEMRSLFRARDGYYLLGYDASALEARVMGHYTWKYDDGEFARELLEGDVHTKNAKAFGVTRNEAKSIFYGIIYGAQPAKISKMLKCSLKEAKKIFNDFWRVNPGLGKLRERVIAISNRSGYVPGLDGRLVYTRSEHSALNTVFQSAGAIIMKYSMLLMEKYKTDVGFDYEQIIFYHDEFEGEVLERSVYETDSGLWCLAAEYSIKSLEEAGRILKVRVPLTGEAKIGRTWADVH